MASTKPKFAGWSFSFGEGTRLILKRDEDGLEIKNGDSILVNDPDGGAPLVCLIRDAQIGTDDYIVLRGVNYLRRDEVENEPLETIDQELFLTSVQDKLYVKDIIEKANVLNPEEFEKIVIDDSNQDNTFLCRRGYDTYYKIYSDYVNIETIKRGLDKDPDGEMETLRNLFVKSLYSERKPPSPKKRRAPRARRDENDEQKPTPTSKKPKPSRSKPTKKPTEQLFKRETSTKFNKGGLREHVVSDVELDYDKDTKDKGTGYISPDSSGIEEINEADVIDVGDDDDDDDSEDEDSESEESSDGDDLFDDDDEFRPQGKKTGKTRGKYNKSGTNKKFPTKRAKGAVSSANLSYLDDKLKVEDSIKKNDDQEQSSPSKQLKSNLNSSADASIASLPCREDQFNQLYIKLESNISSQTGACIYISGTPGTGKTATVREVIRKLSKESHQKSGIDFNFVEINGMKLMSPQHSFEILWNKVDGSKTTASGVQQQLETYFNQGKAERPLVVLLDELDQIATKNQSVMYNFFNWPTYSKSKLIVVAVANTMDLPERILTNKVASRIGLDRIQFPGYTHEDLKKIISSRLEIFDNGEINLTKDAIEYASRKVASVSGDARRALKICRRAVEIAETDYEAAGKIHDQLNVQILHINKAINEITNSPVANYIADLSFVGKLLLTAILTRKRRTGLAETPLGDVIDEVKQIVTLNPTVDQSLFITENKGILDILYEDFIIRPRGFAYVLNELIEAGIVLQQNLKSERTSLIKLGISDEEIKSVFKKEKSLQYFLKLITDA
ncbi:Origin recognition complex subunit 1 [Wickerhamomyces ciferrii]|uniref:Origin recognition complex subunit 1 n=1 Tax=Wickerhamomyces ciferrii (strain ATCC 14091 / BCRC 22168 / CBS 111 / JCM 3599 / NBRC 0793 / NRRL Y-1031 F-60-10) TaxID=1206466 RepID=K0KKM8_WICCF|nr:Origin recognition complex subunit 1 [Wickerhamomyces ciferrii]CCH45750.1 Origin recognition complex subunit 1 [Wickerhamomyces ciferrii]